MYVGHCCLCDFIPFCNVCFAGRSVCCIVYEEMEYLKEILVLCLPCRFWLFISMLL